MPNKTNNLGGPIRRAAAKIRHLFGRHEQSEQQPSMEATSRATPNPSDMNAQPVQERSTRRQSDIGIDVIANTYTPSTSSKSSFRDDGADHHADQEFANGSGNTRWKDEDRFTNKSGDPRIGTHGRTYEPGESRDESRS
ncbi:MAG TPA: hypothetical protein VF618_18765 [Thermoanaerobaculia bacterium]